MSVLINTREAPGPFDALTTLREGEPYFALVGRDKSAPALVLKWAKDRRKKIVDKQAAGTIKDEDADLELQKCTEAEQRAWAMKDYLAGRARDVKGPAPSTSYSGHKLSEETQRADRIMSARIAAARSMGEAAAALNDYRELLDPDDALGLKESVQAAIDLSIKLMPPRAGAIR